MSLDWCLGIRECCTHWRDAAMLQQTFQALERSFDEENDACIDCAKSVVEVVCRVIVDELDDPTAPMKPKEDSPTFGAWVSAAVRVLKLGDVRHNAFQKLVSQHHKLTETLGALRNDAGPVSHGKDGFIKRLSVYHHRAAVLSADAIVAFLHAAYVETAPNLLRTREPYERFASQNAAIDRNGTMRIDSDEYETWTLVVSMGRDEEFTLDVRPSQLLFHLDRQAYIEAARVGQEADLAGFEAVDLPVAEQAGGGA